MLYRCICRANIFKLLQNVMKVIENWVFSSSSFYDLISSSPLLQYGNTLLSFFLIYLEPIINLSRMRSNERRISIRWLREVRKNDFDWVLFNDKILSYSNENSGWDKLTIGELEAFITKFCLQLTIKCVCTYTYTCLPHTWYNI